MFRLISKNFNFVRGFVTDIPAPQLNLPVLYARIFINNEWHKSESGKKFATRNPATEDIIAFVQQGTVDDINHAVQAARKAFKQDSLWRTMDASKRGILLNKLADLIEKSRTYFAVIVLLKPAEQTPLTALYIAQLTKQADFPSEVVNVVSGFGDAGAALVQHPDVDKIACTGSTEVGKLVKAGAAKSNLKRTTLELGGKSPNIIFKNADINEAVETAHFGLFFNMGQCCCARSRTFVESSIYDDFVERSVARAKVRTVGDPFDMKVEYGPQIDEKQMNKILCMINFGKSEGAKLVQGGNRIGVKGYFIAPTISSEVEDNMKIATDEIFGPVQQILRFNKISEVIERANRSNYGLAAAVYTKDIDKVNYLIQRLRAGTIWVNSYNVLSTQVPFGGYKMSGHGRELGEYGLESYTEIKSVIVKTPHKNS